MTGNVPTGSGLSSSSALVVCAGITSLLGSQSEKKIKQYDLIERLISHERAMGISCGGMDQTISVLGTSGKALYINFNPL